MNIRKIRRAAYRLGSLLGDAEAVDKSIRTRSPQPVAKRVLRKAVYREEGKATRKILRKIGL